jgi:uncharacterized protein (DUF4415 family)
MPDADPFQTDEDNPALSDRQLARMRPATAVFSSAELEALRSQRRPGRPVKVDRKVAIKLRIDPDVLATFKADGPGWQTRMNEALRKAVAPST